MAKSKFDFVSVIIVAACILALIFLIYKTINMYNQNKASQTNNIEQTTGENGETDLYDKDGGTYKFDDEDIEVDEGAKADADGGDDMDDDNSSSGNSSTDGNTTGGSSSSGNSTSSGSKDTKGTGATSGSNSSNTNTRPTTSYTNSGGRYLVVAGSFRQEAYANSHAAKLRRMGYDDTRVSIFNKGAYASVLVDRFSDRGDANALARELENKGIDALVMTKR